MADRLSQRMLAIRFQKDNTRSKSLKLLFLSFLVFAAVWLVAPPHPDSNSVFALIPVGILCFFCALTAAFPSAFADPLASAFEKVYQASQLAPKSGNDRSIQSHVYKLLKSAGRELQGYLGSSYISSNPFVKEQASLLREVRDNFHQRVLPAALSGQLRTSTMENLAQVIDSPSSVGFRELNVDFLTYDPSPTSAVFIKKMFSVFRRSWAWNVVEALGLGYLTVGLVSLIYALATQQNFLEFIKDSQFFLWGGLAVSGITFWRKRG